MILTHRRDNLGVMVQGFNLELPEGGRVSIVEIMVLNDIN